MVQLVTPLFRPLCFFTDPDEDLQLHIPVREREHPPRRAEPVREPAGAVSAQGGLHGAAEAELQHLAQEGQEHVQPGGQRQEDAAGLQEEVGQGGHPQQTTKAACDLGILAIQRSLRLWKSVLGRTKVFYDPRASGQSCYSFFAIFE